MATRQTAIYDYFNEDTDSPQRPLGDGSKENKSLLENLKRKRSQEDGSNAKKPKREASNKQAYETLKEKVKDRTKESIRFSFSCYN